MMTDSEFTLCMLRSAIDVLAEAAAQAESKGALDAFFSREVPLARADAAAAIADLERQLRRSAPRAA